MWMQAPGPTQLILTWPSSIKMSASIIGPPLHCCCPAVTATTGGGVARTVMARVVAALSQPLLVYLWWAWHWHLRCEITINSSYIENPNQKVIDYLHLLFWQLHVPPPLHGGLQVVIVLTVVAIDLSSHDGRVPLFVHLCITVFFKKPCTASLLAKSSWVPASSLFSAGVALLASSISVGAGWGVCPGGVYLSIYLYLAHSENRYKLSGTGVDYRLNPPTGPVQCSPFFGGPGPNHIDWSLCRTGTSSWQFPRECQMCLQEALFLDIWHM